MSKLKHRRLLEDEINRRMLSKLEKRAKEFSEKLSHMSNEEMTSLTRKDREKSRFSPCLIRIVSVVVTMFFKRQLLSLYKTIRAPYSLVRSFGDKSSYRTCSLLIRIP
jgi:hypothetical protein